MFYYNLLIINNYSVFVPNMCSTLPVKESIVQTHQNRRSWGSMLSDFGELESPLVEKFEL